MRLPEEFLQSLDGITGFDREAFINVHEQSTTPTSIRINPAKAAIEKWQPAAAKSNTDDCYSPITCYPELSEGHHSQVPWCSAGFYLSERPSFTFDPLFHAGLYYVQEASSMFLEQPFKQLLDLSQPLKVLDLCAAPGGKSTHIQSLLSKDSLLVSNEVIKQRSYVLSDNIIKWGCQNVFVTANDPKAFQKLAGYFDVMVVDAPCSGSGLFRKDREAIEEWSFNNVQLCSQRQQRILADALPALKKDGLLIYSTCSYSAAEDEQIMDWLVSEMDMENIELQTEAWPGIVPTVSLLTRSAGYRFYPDKLKGEGFFLACFRKKGEDKLARLRSSKQDVVTAKEKMLIEQWITGSELSFIYYRNEIIALPQNLVEEFSVLHPLLHIQYAGVRIGAVLKDKVVPQHAFAQSTLLSSAVPVTELSYEEAIKYLQRQDLAINTATTGWQVVCYKSYPLGWINALKNRVNNYYPKEIRILKAQNNIAFKK
jgi:16S rRNA C967 or C1407 C5-methylase (RsmB/RsmF family)/NOL1/NOP2/fmu family ribosome biogenesis protein